MKNFSENTEINILISQHLLKITDGKYPDDEWDCLELNKLDRQRHAEEIADIYFRKNDYNSC